ncbi:MAG: hypothetical protein JXR46_00450 [Calditrichaceae bacterium]|nr:hypothetical protein [Calditrichaceae bacterium]MBN2707483.1 hypothetical protein [Calditrichaceae bacterium]RQV95573.1 MAG: hypothetical protein EH224_06850 [Calditrichota bacterium]
MWSQFFSYIVKKLVFKSFIIEFNPILFSYVRNVLKIPITETNTAAAFTSKTFDIIYHFEVLSHFYDPINEFKIMNKRLNLNGWMIFETGNLGEVDTIY